MMGEARKRQPWTLDFLNGFLKNFIVNSSFKMICFNDFFVSFFFFQVSPLSNQRRYRDFIMMKLKVKIDRNWKLSDYMTTVINWAESELMCRIET